MSATFDEGGAAGLLINQLRLDSDHCQLMMDANSQIMADVAPISSIPINVSSLRSKSLLLLHLIVNYLTEILKDVCDIVFLK